MTTSVVTDMNLGGSKQSFNGGRRKTKSESTQKKNKQPRRGLGVEQLERIISEDNSKMDAPSIHHLHHQLPPPFNPSVGLTTSGCTAVTNAAVHYRLPYVSPPVNWIHGTHLYSMDRVMDPLVFGSSNGGLRFENSKELSSVPSYENCTSDCCGVCHKKKRINRGSFCGNYTVVEMLDAGKTRRSSGQMYPNEFTKHVQVISGASSLTEYEFFPGICGGSPTTAWCGNGSSVAGVLGFRGGEGSCVTAITGGEEGSVSSIDLSLKLSY
ncbi:hypothetical protein R6Q57_025926 [Mikania cordata]